MVSSLDITVYNELINPSKKPHPSIKINPATHPINNPSNDDLNKIETTITTKGGTIDNHP